MRRFGSTRPNRRHARRAWCPEPIAALEGRALLTASALDATFGVGGGVLGGSNVSTSYSTQSRIVAIAVQSDGKIVTAEANSVYNAAGATTPLAIHRYNANGAVDTAFGSDGLVVIPYAGSTPPRNLTITPSGQILLAVDSMAVRLNPDGQYDGSFGQEFGEVGVGLPIGLTQVNSIVRESNGRIIVAGVVTANMGINQSATPEVALMALTATGLLDRTFGNGGVVAVPAASANIVNSGGTVAVTALRLTPTGQVLVGALGKGPGSDGRFTANPPGTSVLTLAQFNPDGTVDGSFGSGGIVQPFGTSNAFAFGNFVVQTNGLIVIAGTQGAVTGLSPYVLARLNANGTTDGTFAPPIPASNQGGGGFSDVAVAADGSVTGLTYDGAIERFTSTGAVDTTFGFGGSIQSQVPAAFIPNGINDVETGAATIALTASGKILTGGSVLAETLATSGPYHAPLVNVQASLLVQYSPVLRPVAPNDYDSDGKSDLVATLTQYGVFATRTARTNTVQAFGPGGDAIPIPGNFDGVGGTYNSRNTQADPAVYSPSLGVVIYRPSLGGPDVSVRFGPTGAGQAIPVPGDYDGDGKTDVAFFLPGSATFIVDPTITGAPYQFQFGSAGVGASIPAPGDYDGDGRTDFAVYLPALGVLAIDPSSTGQPYAVNFGLPGAGQTIPVPGDYDGDGKTDVAVYLPTLGVVVARPSSGGPDVPVRFGPTGLGAAIPVPGDYDGDGKTDVALFLPDSAVYAVDPSGGGQPYAQQFGALGAGNTVPLTPVPGPSGTVSTMSLAATAPDASVGVPVYLPDDLPGSPEPRKATT